MNTIRRRPTRAGVAALAAATLLGGVAGVGAGGAAGAATPPTDPPVAVTAFALGTVSSRVVDRDAHALTTLTTDGVLLRADGRSVVPPDAPTRRGARLARAHGLHAEVLLSNYSDRTGDFDPRVAHRLLSSPAARQRVADQLSRVVAAGRWDGLNIDLERVRARDARGLVAFVRAVQAAMPAERTVSVDISAATSVSGYRQRGYALGPLARAADVVVVMAYDQHGPTWSGPGPIGDLRWQRRAMDAAASVVPAAQLDLGVAGYGYTWPRRGIGHPVRVARARTLAERDGVRPTWHRASGEWSARLDNGTVLWWSDGRSYRLRLRLAEQLGVHGVAVWRLGLADPL